MLQHEINYVLSYNTNPNRLLPHLVKPGAKIDWKRNGQRGGQIAEIKEYSDKKPFFVLIQNLNRDGQPVGRKVWIKKNSILRVL